MMARARNIKPGFFVNEDLTELDAWTRLLFIGLWTLADKAGRLEDRPKKIKIGVFPVDSVDVEEMLQGLARFGFINRYEVNGSKYIQIVNWDRHQNPHHTEKESVIPDINGVLTVKKPVKTSDSPSQYGGNPADSLIPDSLIPDKEVSKDTLSPAKLPDCPHQEIIALFSKNLPELPQPKPELWDGARAKNLAARWKWCLTKKSSKTGKPYAEDKESALDWFDRFFGYVAQSDFLTGRDGKWQNCDLAWLVKADNFAKVLQGNYENKG